MSIVNNKNKIYIYIYIFIFLTYTQKYGFPEIHFLNINNYIFHFGKLQEDFNFWSKMAHLPSNISTTVLDKEMQASIRCFSLRLITQSYGQNIFKEDINNANTCLCKKRMLVDNHY